MYSIKEFKFDQLIYDITTTYSGYAHVRDLLERGNLGEFETLDSLVMAYIQYRKEMQELTGVLCNQFNSEA